jgi:hypothetical protein
MNEYMTDRLISSVMPDLIFIYNIIGNSRSNEDGERDPTESIDDHADRSDEQNLPRVCGDVYEEFPHLTVKRGARIRIFYTNLALSKGNKRKNSRNA